METILTGFAMEIVLTGLIGL